MKTIAQDVRFALRILKRNRTHTATILALLALAIGANTTIFSIVNFILLRPLPYSDPERLVEVWAVTADGSRRRVSDADFVAIRNQNHVFEEAAAYQNWSSILSGHDDPVSVGTTFVSPELFSALGITPFLGRTFLPEEARPGGNASAFLSYDLWEHRFKSNPKVIGQPIMLDRKPYTVVGVAPPGFAFPSSHIDLWLPLAVTEGRTDADKLAIAKLRPGIDRKKAQAEMSLIVSRLSSSDNRNRDLKVFPLRDREVEELRPALLLLFVAVGFVLLLACSNIATMLIARSASRRREIAIRAALGASRLSLIRQLLTEGVLLAFGGGALGVALAAVSMRLVRRFALDNVPHLDRVHVDTRVLLFALLLSLTTSLLFGLLPAVRLSKTDFNTALRQTDARSVANLRLFRRHALGATLVISEVALALTLLITSGVLLRSLHRLSSVDLGFDPQNVLTMWITLPESEYQNGQQIRTFFQQILERVEALPGVQAAGINNNGLFSGPMTITLSADALTPADGRGPVEVEYRVVSPDFFRALGLRLVKGRYFSKGADLNSAAAEVIVDDTLARRFWPDHDAVGQHFTLEGWGKPKHGVEVVGVVSGTRDVAVDSEAKPTLYVSYVGDPRNASSMALFVRVDSAPMSIVDAVRRQIRAVDKHQAPAGVMTVEKMLSEYMAPPRYRTWFLEVFASVAFALAMLGIYGLISYVVELRTREIAIRMALGGRQGDVLKMILWQGLGLTLMGVVIGLLMAAAATHSLSSMLYGIRPFDGATFAVISLVFIGAALSAATIPAIRATKVDPMSVLRHE